MVAEMLLQAFPAAEGFSCCLGRSDWPQNPHEILLHPRDLEALRVPAFGYVLVRCSTNLRHGHAKRGSSNAADHSGGKGAEQCNDLVAFFRAIPDDFLQIGEAKVPVWLLRTAGVKPMEQIFVARTVAPSPDTRTGTKSRKPFRLELSFYTLGADEIVSDVKGSSGDRDDSVDKNEKKHRKLSRQSKAIARRLFGYMVRPGSLLAVEVLGETIVLQVIAITDDENTTTSCLQGESALSPPARLSNVSGTGPRLSTAQDRQYPVRKATSSAYDFDLVSVPQIVVPSTEVLLVQPSSAESKIQGTQHGPQGRGRRLLARGEAIGDSDVVLTSDATWTARWSERAPGLEVALSELQALILLCVESARKHIGVPCFDRRSWSEGGDKNAGFLNAPSHGGSLDANVTKNHRYFDFGAGRRGSTVIDNSSEGVGIRGFPSNDNDAVGNSEPFRWSDVLPSGIALCGPSGVGKTLALDLLSEDLIENHGVHVTRLLGPQILADFSGHGGNKSDSSVNRQSKRPRGSLALALDKACARVPALLVIDELDVLFDAIGENESPTPHGEGASASSALLEMLDRASRAEGVAVIGATRRSPGGRGGAGWTGLEDEGRGSREGMAMPSIYRKPGRFDRCVVIGPPTQSERERILLVLLVAPGWELEPLEVESSPDKSMMLTSAVGPNSEGIDNAKDRVVGTWAKRLSLVTPGMVGGDLERLVRTARARATRRTRIATARTTTLLYHILTWRDAMGAAAITVPRALRGTDVTSSSWIENGSSGRGPTWDSVGGFSEVKRQLQRLVQWPWLHPDAFARMGISAPAGALLCGPSGCGKTLVARVLAAECLANFVWVRSSELLSRYGEEVSEAK